MKVSLILVALVANLMFVLVGTMPAQTFTTLYNFTAPNNVVRSTNSDGAAPFSGLVLSGTVLYGTAFYGGSLDRGTLFAVNTNGTGFSVLHTFAGDPSDGGDLAAGLTLSGTTFYGAARTGGSGANGTIFKINMDGTDYSTLYNFTTTDPSVGTNSDGAYLYANLIISSGTLYGTAAFGGRWGNGVVFKVNSDGSAFTTLHVFTVGDSSNRNSDGAYPFSSLVLSGNTLYGTAADGGSSANGTVFKVNTDGTGFAALHQFSVGAYYTNSDGWNPEAGLVLSGNTLYGTAAGGGAGGRGTVFKMNTDGTGFITLHTFTPTSSPCSFCGTNNDGAVPLAGLILSGNILYGTASAGGSYGSGTVFALNTDGTGFTNLYTFMPTTTNPSGNYTNSDGATPRGSLMLSGNILYGTASSGGAFGNGTVFRISLPIPPELAITRTAADLILAWPLT